MTSLPLTVRLPSVQMPEARYFSDSASADKRTVQSRMVTLSEPNRPLHCPVPVAAAEAVRAPPLMITSR